VCENNTIWRADFKMAGVCYFHVYGLQKDYTVHLTAFTRAMP